MKKLVAKLKIYDEKDKKKALKIVSGQSGIESIHIELKDQKLTVVGDIDPVSLVNKLRKFFTADIVSVGPAKEEKKKEEPAKKEEPKKGEEKKGTTKDSVAELVKAYEAYNPYMTTHYYVRSVEGNPNACVIC